MKLTQDDVDRICRRVVDHDMDTQYVANQHDVTRRHVQRLAKQYRETGEIPTQETPGRRPYADHPDDLEERVLELREELRMGAVAIAHVLRQRDGLSVDHNKVHDILQTHGEAGVNKRKQGRRRPWVRWERSFPLETVHMDWYHNRQEEWCLAVQDDASRCVLAMVEQEARSAETSVALLDDVRQAHASLARIEEVITDHGSEFYASKRDPEGEATHPFENYVAAERIQHTRCRVGRPQTNGKLERFFQTYGKHRWEEASLEAFLGWFNEVRPHMSLDWEALETPREAFDRLAKPIILGNFVRLAEGEGGV